MANYQTTCSLKYFLPKFPNNAEKHNLHMAFKKKSHFSCLLTK